ncbi:hypothetical protein HB662_18620 [Roseomonas frigidaquae]|uniref:Uncharacterized protein n=1 Tax=Falsiroseomonas frigidaquae TaxID=487318 RepID=A0ABX1F3F1_9PROT|nr:hypothetical protein [Falsiroseomonas frigidaquae]NKE46801.1 hypothetical protein [Falsiroseomonas frigidaquae]
MTWSLDARIPLRLLSPPHLEAALQGAPATALLVEGVGLEQIAAPAVFQMPFLPGEQTHKVDCSCCAGRGAVAEALDRMFQARIRGRCAWFDQVIGVIGTVEAQREVLGALDQDPLARARFRLV